MQRRYLIGLIVVIAACVIAVILALGYYPIASVNGDIITASAFRTELAAARTYSQNARNTYGDLPTSTIQFSAATDADLARLVLDTMVENAMVHGGLNAIVGDGAARIVAEKVDGYAPKGELAGASQVLFGLSEGSFRTYILTPQAEREVLGSKLFLDGNTLEIWTKDARAQARVRIYSPRYAWDGSQVVAR